MADWTMRENDTLPAITATLRGTDGQPIDLTGASVKFQMSLANGGASKVNAAAAVISDVDGTVRYDWIAADTDTPGSYEFTWQITFGSGAVLTCPNGGNNTATIVADLAT